jgi:hypothetical protein
MYWGHTGIRNTRRSMQMLCERRACLNEACRRGGNPTRSLPKMTPSSLEQASRTPGVPGQPELIGNVWPNIARTLLERTSGCACGATPFIHVALNGRDRSPLSIQQFKTRVFAALCAAHFRGVQLGQVAIYCQVTTSLAPPSAPAPQQTPLALLVVVSPAHARSN